MIRLNIQVVPVLDKSTFHEFPQSSGRCKWPVSCFIAKGPHIEGNRRCVVGHESSSYLPHSEAKSLYAKFIWPVALCHPCVVGVGPGTLCPIAVNSCNWVPKL